MISHLSYFQMDIIRIINFNSDIKDFTKNFEQLHDNVGDVDKYLPVVYTKGELEELL